MFNLYVALIGSVAAFDGTFATAKATVSPVPDVVEDPNWLVAASGMCSNLNVVMRSRDLEDSGGGDTAAHFIADISFKYYPEKQIKFTDFPYHISEVMDTEADEVALLVDSGWDHRNIALLQPTSSCDTGTKGASWDVSVFKVEEHRACADGESAWEGHPCVHYSGYVSAETAGFVTVNQDRFICQLFVDGLVGGLISGGLVGLK